MKFSGIIKRGSYDVIIPYAGRKVPLGVACRGKGDGHIYLQLVGLKEEGVRGSVFTRPADRVFRMMIAPFNKEVAITVFLNTRKNRLSIFSSP